MRVRLGIQSRWTLASLPHDRQLDGTSCGVYAVTVSINYFLHWTELIYRKMSKRTLWPWPTTLTFDLDLFDVGQSFLILCWNLQSSRSGRNFPQQIWPWPTTLTSVTLTLDNLFLYLSETSSWNLDLRVEMSLDKFDLDLRPKTLTFDLDLCDLDLWQLFWYFA